MENSKIRQEIIEAVDAGERALDSLYLAQQHLNSAGNWGLLDIFGGGMLSGFMKHSKLGDAANMIEQAKQDLYRFEKELRDVNVSSNLSIDISDFLTFADFFFDGAIADFMVQSRIGDARKKVNDAINQVEYIVNDLKRSLS